MPGSLNDITIGFYIFIKTKRDWEGRLETGNFFFRPENCAVYGRSSKVYDIIAESYL
jgi:hypothetical protein